MSHHNNPFWFLPPTFGWDSRPEEHRWIGFVTSDWNDAFEWMAWYLLGKEEWIKEALVPKWEAAFGTINQQLLPDVMIDWDERGIFVTTSFGKATGIHPIDFGGQIGNHNIDASYEAVALWIFLSVWTNEIVTLMMSYDTLEEIKDKLPLPEGLKQIRRQWHLKGKDPRVHLRGLQLFHMTISPDGQQFYTFAKTMVAAMEEAEGLYPLFPGYKVTAKEVEAAEFETLPLLKVAFSEGEL